MNYEVQIQLLEQELKSIDSMSGEEVQEKYNVDTKEEAVTLIEEEINYINEKQEESRETCYPERYYHYLDVFY